MNVGAILRTADGINAERVYLTGYTATPEHPKVAKTSLGAENSVPWEHIVDTKELIQRKKTEGYQIVGLELTRKAKKVWDVDFQFPVALVVGNEIHGIPEDEQKLCDQMIYLPMLGSKESLNVATSTGVTTYEMLRQYDIAKK
jgi:tRNA G18 (ribose-2'-O)-methylase SpoU